MFPGGTYITKAEVGMQNAPEDSVRTQSLDFGEPEDVAEKPCD